MKPFAADIWTVDGPEITMRSMGVGLPFTTRMTVLRLPSGALWLHSPIAWDDRLASDIRTLGPVTCLVAPSTLHYWYLPEWQEAFPDARSFAPAALAAKAKRPVRIDEAITGDPPDAWLGHIDQCVVSSRLFTEADFFHRSSRTLIITDLIENFEPDRVRNPWLRRAVTLFGAAAPDGKAPYDMQWSFFGRRKQLRDAVERMIAWAPERIIVAHGRCYDHDGVTELRRAFRWVGTCEATGSP